MVRTTVNKAVFCEQSCTVGQEFFAPIDGFIAGNGGNSRVQQHVLSGIGKQIEHIAALKSECFGRKFGVSISEVFLGVFQSKQPMIGAFMVDGGTARFYGDGSSRKLNYVYIPKSELENQSISGLNSADITVLRKLPGATVEKVLIKEATANEDRIEKAYYRIPISSDYMNDDPSSPERVQLDKAFSGSAVYKDNNAYQEE